MPQDDPLARIVDSHRELVVRIVYGVRPVRGERVEVEPQGLDADDGHPFRAAGAPEAWEHPTVLYTHALTKQGMTTCKPFVCLQLALLQKYDVLKSFA